MLRVETQMSQIQKLSYWQFILPRKRKMSQTDIFKETIFQEKV